MREGAKMDYRKYGDVYYIRLDRGDEVVSSIYSICKKENIASATYSGIGGCGEAQIQTFIPETGAFESLAAGHVKSITITYTAEIELRPVVGGTIGRRHDPETGTGFWEFSD